jgi:hypothetical protein
MKLRKPSGSFAPHEVQQFILPMGLSTIVIMTGLILGDIFDPSVLNPGLIVYGLILILGTIANHFAMVRTADFRETYGWMNAILSAIGLGLLPYIVPARMHEAAHILIPFGVISAAIVSGRRYAYTVFLIILILGLFYRFGVAEAAESILEFGMPFIISIVIVEAVLHIKDTTQQHMHRLETINKVSRQIMLSLDTEKTISLLDVSIHETLEADT